MWEQPSIFPKSQKSQQSQSTPGLNSQQSLTQQPSQAQSPRQQPASETWIRFQITPDVELSVRGIQTDQQMARMKSVANNLRDILIGGQNE
jgi:hypothetical protein